ncbi:MAG: hypothetical protein ETSY1_32145 [Candidatus Entotheonella factor]|uniref:Uncharacterized protein n=1 Tax=Entotheonella factor TaxID=1429438 RepID=W4LAX4_ENTF1|nr:tetratricopeptide repeat protein [Candidatus Entotheonella palauensis]ETW95084.1 MAG: hypothetical protein ETSY1_32145 [Candidatus Entotheonella factor]
MDYGTRDQTPVRFRHHGLLAVLWGCWLLWGSVLGPPVAWGADRTELEYAKGVLAYGDGDYMEALSHLRRAVDLSPQHSEARFYLGLTFFRLGEFQYAIDALQWVVRLDPDMRHVHHHLGAAYLQLRRYDEALAQFQLAETHETDNSDTLFYLGYTYYQLKQYREAPPYFQRALELDPSLAGTAQYYQGLAFYASERDRLARAAFERAVHTDPAAPLAGQAQRYLKAIERRKHQSRLFQLQGNIGLEYDDNVVLEPNDDVLEFGEKRDGRTVFSLGVRLMPVRQRDWQLGATYDLFQSVHFNLSDFNVQSHTLGLFTQHPFGRFSLRGEINYNVTLLDFDYFSDGLTLQPSLVFRQTDALFAELLTSLNLTRYDDNIAASEDPDVRGRDGYVIRVGLRQTMQFNQNKSSVSLGYQYEGSRNDGTDWEYDSHNLTLGLYTPLWWEIILYLDGAYHYRDYLHVNSYDQDTLGVLTAADQRERLDNRFVGSVALVRRMGSFLTLSFSYVYTRNRSNLDFFDYRRNVMSVQLTGRY